MPGCPVVTAGVRTGPAAAGLPVECALCLLGDGDGHGLIVAFASRCDPTALPLGLVFELLLVGLTELGDEDGDATPSPSA
jgi:hypothetical protein